RGRAPNTAGIGALLTLRGGPVAQIDEMICGGRYLSSDMPSRTFASGAATRVNLEVQWPSGLRSSLTNIPVNSICEVDEAAASKPIESREVSPQPMFEDISNRIAHIHREEPFDDFARQPLLPRQLSQLGPGVAWADLDGDGREELLIGSGRNGALAIFDNLGDGRVRLHDAAWLAKPVARDLTGLVSWDTTAIPGSAHFEARL